MSSQKQPKPKTTKHQRQYTHFSTRKETVSDYYTFEKIIGGGSFGVVRLAISVKDPTALVAVKSINKLKLTSPAALLKLKHEVAALFQLDHPNILRLIESYEDERYLHLVTEYCSGGELFTKVSGIAQYSEAYVASLVKQMLRAVRYLHRQGICHRDIKPQNFLFESEATDSQVKLIDFGLSTFFSSDLDRMSTICGSPNFMSPEMIKRHAYTSQCDVWSVGVILYCLLCSSFPFQGRNMQELFSKIEAGQYTLDGPRWSKISEDAKDLLRDLLNSDPERRLSPKAALRHQWFSTASSKERITFSSDLCLSVERSGSSYKEVFAQFMRCATAKSIKKLQSALQKSPTECLTPIEFANTLRQQKFIQRVNDVDLIFSELGLENEEHVDCPAFIQAVLDHKRRLDKEHLRTVFAALDEDNTGVVKVELIAQAVATKGITRDDLLRMFRRAKIAVSKDQVTYEEFERVFCPTVIYKS